MTDARLPAGHVVGQRYVVESLIGRGGMGEVYAARDQKLERKVALKIVASATSPTAKRRLQAEAKAVASIEHPGIVTLHDVVEDGDALVLVMELVKGTSLRDALAAGPLAPRTVASVVRGVAEALEAAHARGLVHRDVKPDNVIVRKDGRTALLDFGVAKAVTPNESPLAATVTGEGAVVGTPAYLAPEQARGEGVSPATDQFALAVTAYELLTGEMPWAASGVPAIIAAIVSSPPLPVEVESAGEMAAEIDAVFARALAKPPDERFPSVTEFASALDLALGGDGGSVRAKSEVTPDGPYPSSVARSSDRRAVRGTQVIHADDRAPSKPSGDRAAPNGKTMRSNDAAPRQGGRGTWARVGVIGLVVATALGLGLWVTRGRDRPAGAASAAGSGDPAQAGATFEALDAAGAAGDPSRARFHEAARAYRRGEVNAARRGLDQLIAAEPGFASAQLMRAYLSFVLRDELDEPARAALRAATAHADVLGARDAAFLKALTPSFLDPPKWRDTADLLEEIVAKAPADVRALEALGFARVKLGDYPAAERVFRLELGVDPGAVVAHGLVGQIRFEAGDADGSKRQLEACMREQPGSTYCRTALAIQLNEVGECAEADRLARDAISLDPAARRAAAARASAIAGLGATREVIAQLLSDAYKTLPPEGVAAARAEDAVLLAWRAGDFTEVLAALDAASADDKLPSAEASRFAVMRVRALWEMDERARAADAAEAYLSRAPTLRLPERVWTDPTGRMLAYLRAAGRISAQEHQRRVDAWFASWRARRSGNEWRLEAARYIWPLAYGSPDRLGEAEARAALEAAKGAEFEARPRPNAAADAFDEIGSLAGGIYAAAGRDAEAEAFLSTSTRSCRVAPDQRAWLALGDLAAKKDKVRACAAYDEIEKAWRDAKPKSVTLDAARAASSKLGCGDRR